MKIDLDALAFFGAVAAIWLGILYFETRKTEEANRVALETMKMGYEQKYDPISKTKLWVKTNDKRN